MARRPLVTSSRLFEAADVLLAAIESPDGLNSTIPMDVGGPRGRGAAPSELFTHTELVEALDFLIRMGYIGPECDDQ